MLRLPLPLTLVLVLMGLAGCANSGGPDLVPVQVLDDHRDPGEFWMVWVHGNETRRMVAGSIDSQAMCSVAFSHRLDLARRTLHYDGRRYDFNAETVQIVVAFDHWARPSDCPLAYTLVADPGTIVQEMGRYGTLRMTVEAGGAVVVGDERAPLGSALRFTYDDTDTEGGSTYRYEGIFTVENLGAWPSRALIAN